MDWDDIRTFLAITRARTLSGAARALGVRQSTMSRRLEALEKRVGARLLHRTPGGYELTALGEAVLGNAERMEAEVIAVERTVQGRDIALSGIVRVTTVDTVATRLMPWAIAMLQETHPGICVELLPQTRSLSLSKREADIALRMARFEGNELITRRVGSFGHGLYASRSYLAAHGPVEGEGAGHAIITVLDDQAHLPEVRWLRSALPHARVALGTNSREAQFHAVKAGIGIACMSHFLAEGEADLVRIEAAGEGPEREMWLGVHRDLRHMPRIRAVIDAIGETLKTQVGRRISH